MKIRTNYDLIEEAQLASKGFTLKRYMKGVTTNMTISLLACSPTFIAKEIPVSTVTSLVLAALPLCFIVEGAVSTVLKKLNKVGAFINLNNLANQLGNIYVDTNANMLMEAKAYETEYKLDCESFPPKLREHKYIMVPVNNDWGNNERSLLQEHVIGTRRYDLSYGEPEKEKVYTYKMKRVINK